MKFSITENQFLGPKPRFLDCWIFHEPRNHYKYYFFLISWKYAPALKLVKGGIYWKWNNRINTVECENFTHDPIWFVMPYRSYSFISHKSFLMYAPIYFKLKKIRWNVFYFFRNVFDFRNNKITDNTRCIYTHDAYVVAPR